MSRERFQVGQQNWRWTKGGIYKSKMRKGKKLPKQELGPDFISSAWGMKLVTHKHGDNCHTKKLRKIISNPCEKNRRRITKSSNDWTQPQCASAFSPPSISSSPPTGPLHLSLYIPLYSLSFPRFPPPISLSLFISLSHLFSPPPHHHHAPHQGLVKEGRKSPGAVRYDQQTTRV